MSIYSPWMAIDEDHDESCRRWVKCSKRKADAHPQAMFAFDGSCYYFDESRPCTCGELGPWIYQGSHILPAVNDPRGGGVLACAIPDHITRDGRDDGKEGPKDWLRLTVFAEPWEGPETTWFDGTVHRHIEEGGQACVVLNREQVQRMRDTLTAWLDREPEE